MKNIELALKVIKSITYAGVHEFILCAGARNSPFVESLQMLSQFDVKSFFDERSASFYALGRSLETQKPIAVITTSGTAVSEMLSAAVEATYVGAPLIFVTADRPKTYRMSGAPQTIRQDHIFSHYAEAFVDLDVTSNLSVDGELSSVFSSWSQKQPLHLNVCFDEPLIDFPLEKVASAYEEVQSGFVTVPAKKTGDSEKIDDRVFKNPLVILSSINSSLRADVLRVLSHFDGPIYVEAPSGMRGAPELEKNEIRSSDLLIGSLFEKNICDSVIRVGGVPTLRFWRDLEAKFKGVPVLSVTDLEFSGLSRATQKMRLSDFVEQKLVFENSELLKLFFARDHFLSEEKENLLKEFSRSEPAWIERISQSLSCLKSDSRVYLGNSLTIRNWDSYSVRSQQRFQIQANRGANGIDGQISTFLGWQGDHAIVGDLTALYDLNALWALRYSSTPKNIFVMNNGGGQIFRRMFKSALFLNEHQIGFEHWAKMFGIQYELWSDTQTKLSQSQQHRIVEILPDDKQTQEFLSHWETLCKKPF